MESQAIKRFAGKNVLVTGAGRGIGRAIVQELHRQGAKVYALSKTKENLESLEKELQTNVVPICVDLSNWKETEEALANLECMDALINNAAYQEAEYFLRITEEQFDKFFKRQMNLNVKAVLHVSQIVAQKMISEGRAGSIVNMNSVAGKAAYATVGVYSTTKAALHMLTKVMAIELGPHKITANCVSPGMVETDFLKNLFTTTSAIANVPVEAVENAFVETMTSKSVFKEPFIEMKQIVNTVLFLASGENGQITGSDIPVDGGFLLL